MNALYPLGLVQFIGLPFALLHKASSPVSYECGACGEKFGVRSEVAKVALAILWIVGGFFVTALLGFCVMVSQNGK